MSDRRSAVLLHRLLSPYAAFNAADSPEGWRGSVSRYLALLAVTTGRWDEAQHHFEDALATNARMGTRPWLAHTQNDYARMLLERDALRDRERARALLDDAISIYRELGMAGYAARAAALEQEVGTAG